MHSETANRPTPENIFNTLIAFHRSAALRTAIELDIFTAIGDGENEPPSLAKKVGAAERGVRTLCDVLTVLEFLTKRDGQYALTQESAIFLNRRSPAYVGSMTGFLHNDTLVKNFAELTEAVRKGGTVSVIGDNEKPHEEMWVTFAKSMASLSAPAAELTGIPWGQPCKVLDIAAGHGMYGITMAKHNPNAQITAPDWPKVLEVAQENARSAGVTERFTTRPGSAFDADLGDGYDYALLTNIFHHFDKGTCEKLMKRH